MDSDVYKCVKLPLCKLLKNHKYDDFINIFSKNNYKIQLITTNAYDFIKLYFCSLLEKNLQFPKIDRNFYITVCEVISIHSKKGRPNNNTNLLNILSDFYETNYSKLNPTQVESNNLSNILDYEADSYITHLETNIKEHYVDHVINLLKLCFKYREKYGLILKIKTKEEQKIEKIKLFEEFKKIKNDVFSTNRKSILLCSKENHKWVNKIRELIVPKKEKYKENSIFYDIECDPQSYLLSMFRINNKLEKMNTKENPLKLFNVLPLRTGYIPSHITIDTAVLINLFLKKDISYNLKNIGKVKDGIWNTFFKFNTCKFKKSKYEFKYYIKTDGISCSLVFVKLSASGKPMKAPRKKISKKEPYIEDQLNLDGILLLKNVIVNDPNYGNLLKMKDKNGNSFRYTRKQRNQESGTKKYTKIREELSETNIRGETIKEKQNKLCIQNSKVTNYNKFNTYLREKYKNQMSLYKHYRQRIFRKLKMNIYINIQKSEAKMVKNIKKNFGGPEKSVLIWGDYDNGGNNIKNKEPIVTKKLRKTLRLAGYKIYLINEFRTSITCNICKEETETFYKREGYKNPVWGLLRCKDKDCKVKTKEGKECRRLFNRDNNSCENMLSIIKGLIHYGKRPKIYCRPCKE